MTPEEFQSEALRLRPKLVGLARQYLLDGDEAEDIVQDAMLKLWMLCPRLHSPIDALAMVIVRNLTIDRLRRSHPMVALTENDIGNDSTPSQEHDHLERMMAVVSTLPDMQQLLLRLRHMEGMEYKDIARLTGSTEQAIRQALSRARKAVREKYKERNQP